MPLLDRLPRTAGAIETCRRFRWRLSPKSFFSIYRALPVGSTFWTAKNPHPKMEACRVLETMPPIALEAFNRQAHDLMVVDA